MASDPIRPQPTPFLTRSRIAPIRRRVWTAGRLVILGTALLGTYLAFFITSMGVATRARDVRVPDVRGKSVAEATDLLTAAGLELQVEPTRRADPKVPANHVILQAPEPGATLRRQRAVRIRVSDGQRDPEVPAVSEQPERSALAALERAQVTVEGQAEIRTADYGPDVVVAQDPPSPGRSRSVALLINRGEGGRTYVMPDLIGAPAATVVNMLRQRQFRIASGTPVSYPGLPPGVVVRQSPQAGYQIGEGDLITIEVSR